MYPATMLVCASVIDGSASSSSAGGPLVASHARSFQPDSRWTTVTTSRGGTEAAGARGVTPCADAGGGATAGADGAGVICGTRGDTLTRGARGELDCAGRAAGVTAGAVAVGACGAACAVDAVCRPVAVAGRNMQASRRGPPRMRPRDAPARTWSEYFIDRLPDPFVLCGSQLPSHIFARDQLLRAEAHGAHGHDAPRATLVPQYHAHRLGLRL